MNIDGTYSLSKLTEGYKKGYSGIPVQTIATLKTDTSLGIDKEECPWKDAYTGKNGGLNGTSKPDVWTDGDTFLVSVIKTRVKYDDSKYGRHETKKSIGRYSSNVVKSQLNKARINLSEANILSDVDEIFDSCDLKGTEIKALPKLKTIGANLTLDADSKLEDLSGLKEVKGYICVAAKNKTQMEEYLKKLGICDVDGNPIPKVKKGIHFVMKNYL